MWFMLRAADKVVGHGVEHAGPVGKRRPFELLIDANIGDRRC